MSARIAGGAFAGRTLFGGTAGVRPTAIRLRKSAFEVVGPELGGVRALDLCAGIGTLGFEALSRGAAFCAFVERSRAAAARIARNAAKLGVGPERFRIHATVADRALGRMLGAGERFDAVFCDPPWALWRSGEARRLAERAAGLAPSLLLLEHPAGVAPGPVAGYVTERTLAAGDSAFALLRPQPDQAHI